VAPDPANWSSFSVTIAENLDQFGRSGADRFGGGCRADRTRAVHVSKQGERELKNEFGVAA
jgi:hypothetical protein